MSRKSDSIFQILGHFSIILNITSFVMPMNCFAIAFYYEATSKVSQKAMKNSQLIILGLYGYTTFIADQHCPNIHIRGSGKNVNV